MRCEKKLDGSFGRHSKGYQLFSIFSFTICATLCPLAHIDHAPQTKQTYFKVNYLIKKAKCRIIGFEG